MDLLLLFKAAIMGLVEGLLNFYRSQVQGT